MPDPIRPTSAHFDIDFRLPDKPTENLKTHRRLTDLDPTVCKTIKVLIGLVKSNCYTSTEVAEKERTHKLVAKIGDQELKENKRLWEVRQTIAETAAPLVFEWKPKGRAR